MNEKEEAQWIERRIVTGMIVSTEFLRELLPLWNPKFLESSTALTLADWCMKYFETYSSAPGREIQSIYSSHLRNGLGQDKAEQIELVLQGLSDEYDREQFNVSHLMDQTRNYFQERNLKNYAEDIRNELLSGNIVEAEKLASNFHPIGANNSQEVDPFANADKIRQAFEFESQPLIRFGKVLGRFWNDQFVREGFVALMGPEKRGKTFWLMELSMRGMSDGSNIGFFQAGDMSEKQQLKRLCIYLAKKSDRQKYCENVWIPVLDCKNNQVGSCRSQNREGITAPCENLDMKKIEFDQLKDAYKANKDHTPCHNCKGNQGTPWLIPKKDVEPLNWKEAWRHLKRWQKRHHKNFRLATYPNETLTVQEIGNVLDRWEKTDNFVPDIVVVDYADILAPDPDCKNLDYRHQQNKIWQRLRRLSQMRRCLVITATQSDADSYEKEVLTMANFTETKSKYAHVTAMYGLNQNDREKKIGIMRINELVVREGDFDRQTQVHVLQRLQTGRPFLGSY